MLFSKPPRLITGLTVLALAWCLASTIGCSHKKSEVDPDHPLILTLDWKPEPEFGGFYQAKLAGEYTKRKVPLEIHNAADSAVPLWQLVDQGQTDFATVSADELVVARAKGADVIALFAVYQTSPQGIMVHKARGFKEIGDVFTNPGALGAQADLAWLKYLLTKYPKPTVQITAAPQGIGDFLARKDFSQQCFITSEPILAARQGGDPQTFLVADAGFNPYVTVLITSKKMMLERAEVVAKVVSASRQGWRAYLDNPSAANAEMGKLNTEMDAQTFTEAAAAQKPFIETEGTNRRGLGSMTLDRWQLLTKQLADLKVVDKAPAAEDCFVDIKIH